MAQATHALMSRWQDEGQMVSTLEVCEYDQAAPNVASTRAALNRAMHLRLADRAGRYWFPTSAAWDMRRPLEDLVLSWEDQ